MDDVSPKDFWRRFRADQPTSLQDICVVIRTRAVICPFPSGSLRILSDDKKRIDHVAYFWGKGQGGERCLGCTSCDGPLRCASWS